MHGTTNVDGRTAIALASNSAARSVRNCGDIAPAQSGIALIHIIFIPQKVKPLKVLR